MKKLLLFFWALGLALAVTAQPDASLSSAPDARMAEQVASPNRIRSAELANDAKRGDHHHRHPRHRADGPDALVWVDAGGNTAGRYIDDISMLVTFDSQLALVRGLVTIVCPPPTFTFTYLGGSRWDPLSPKDLGDALYYTSSDCTGPAYSRFLSPATPYVGVPISEGDTKYIYFFKMADRARLTLYSAFANNQCSATPEGFTLVAAPSAGVVPASDLGVEPFTVK